MKIQNRLLLYLSINMFSLFIISIVSGVFTYYSNNLINELSREIFRSERLVSSIRLEINTIHNQILESILYWDEENSPASLDEHANSFYSNLEEMKILHKEDIGSFNQLRQEFQEYYLFGKWMAEQSFQIGRIDTRDSIDNFRNQKNQLFAILDFMVVEYDRNYEEAVEELNAIERWFFIVISMLLAIGILLGLLLSYMFSRYLAKPVLELTLSISKVEKGEFAIVPGIDRTDEIGQLARAFNSMSTELESRFNNLTYLKSLLQSILDSVGTSVMAVNSHVVVTHWNRNAEILTSVNTEKAVGVPLENVLPDVYLQSAEVQKVIEEKSPLLLRAARIGELDTDRYYNIFVYPHVNIDLKGAVILITEVTHQKMMEKMIIQSEKMLSIGGLAAGMAHEINNPLAGIIQTLSVMEKRILQGETLAANQKAAEKADLGLEKMARYLEERGIPKMFESIKSSGKQITEIVDNMLSFSRKDDKHKNFCSIEELVESVIRLAQSDYDLKKNFDFRKIDISKIFVGNLPSCPCERTQIQQVLLNLLRNAAQALQEMGREDPQIIIETSFLEKKEMVSITITDNGPGMEEQTKNRVFEPFFTTKEQGIGTGLGLSVSYFIITNTHHGEMSVTSSPGKGTTFTINLPLGKEL